jgi:peptide chain release factor 1
LREKEHASRASDRREQIGRAMRVEKIKTYNFPQDRLTDHRVNKSWHNLAGIMDGEIGEILSV